MAKITINVKLDLGKLDRLTSEAKKAAERGMNDVVDDLIRVSSEIAPHDSGVLDKPSAEKTIKWEGGKVVGEVVYSIEEQDRKGKNFNYALWTHEQNYKLGPGSLSKPGTQGMSGTSYRVGNKYLTRPLEGEKNAYKDHIADEIRKELR